MLSSHGGPIQRQRRHYYGTLLLCVQVVSTTGFAVPTSSTSFHRDDRARIPLVGMDSNHVVTSVLRMPSQGLCANSTVWKERPKSHLSPTNTNVTLPTCLMVLEPAAYPTLSRARKAIRKKQVLVQRHGLAAFSASNAFVGKTDTRIFPGDSIAKQTRIQKGGYSGLTYGKPKTCIPIAYEDNHMAIVNKPSGMICYSKSKGGFDTNSVLRVLPHILTPPPPSLHHDALDMPVPVHRLDVPTSGLLVIAKTRSAAVHLSEQFASHKISKSYAAILNGIPTKASEKDTTMANNNKQLEDGNDWNVVNSAIDGKPATTLWRELRRGRCMHASNMTVTLVEFRPLHGRKHQLRRHASEVMKCPIVGDELYDDDSVGAVTLRHERGRILLSSVAVVVELFCQDQLATNNSPNARIHNSKLEARIGLPKYFERFMSQNERKMRNYEKWMQREGLACLVEIYAMSEELLRMKPRSYTLNSDNAEYKIE